jgi:hypothetical protein
VINFRNKIELPDEIEIALIKKGSILVQWSKNPWQKLIIA